MNPGGRQQAELAGWVSTPVPATADVVVIGAGAVGAACATFLVRDGFSVHVVERGQIASGTSSAGSRGAVV